MAQTASGTLICFERNGNSKCILSRNLTCRAALERNVLRGPHLVGNEPNQRQTSSHCFSSHGQRHPIRNFSHTLQRWKEWAIPVTQCRRELTQDASCGREHSVCYATCTCRDNSQANAWEYESVVALTNFNQASVMTDWWKWTVGSDQSSSSSPAFRRTR